MVSAFAGVWLFLFSFVTENILIYRLWDTIRGKTARITPGRAVTYIYIPFFGFYWIYQAYWGCAVDYNRYIAEKTSINHQAFIVKYVTEIPKNSSGKTIYSKLPN